MKFRVYIRNIQLKFHFTTRSNLPERFCFTQTQRNKICNNSLISFFCLARNNSSFSSNAVYSAYQKNTFFRLVINAKGCTQFFISVPVSCDGTSSNDIPHSLQYFAFNGLLFPQNRQIIQPLVFMFFAKTGKIGFLVNRRQKNRSAILISHAPFFSSAPAG